MKLIEKNNIINAVSEVAKLKSAEMTSGETKILFNSIVASRNQFHPPYYVVGVENIL